MSESAKMRTSASENEAAVLWAAVRPRRSCLTHCSLRSSSRARSISQVPSVDPSSTTITSSSSGWARFKLQPAIESRLFSSVTRELWEPIRTLADRVSIEGEATKERNGSSTNASPTVDR